MAIQTEIDYGLLDGFLTAHQWDKAEQETAYLMLKVIGKKHWWEIESDDLKNLPSQALYSINSSWEKTSEGRFGFSVQKQKWQDLASGFNYDSEKRFGDLLGWRKQGSWLSRKELIFDLSAPVGHLPAWGLLIFWLGLPVADTFLERLCNCEFSNSSLPLASATR